ncbi:MAG: iron-containing alcohol dehydrogenase [Spirochaetota bacterium]
MEEVKFTLGRLPLTVFSPGAIATLPEYIKKYGTRILLVTGKRSLKQRGALQLIETLLNDNKIQYKLVTIEGEPTVEQIDSIVALMNHTVDVVVSIGGGSVIDAGKAISAMIPVQGSVADYLEVVGTKHHSGEKIPFIAMPTTAGTGSEATKNAVITKPGKNGFKRSLRHDNFVPDVAIIDPQLQQGSPLPVTAASGLDALTQLIESYVSTQSNPFTDALAFSGIEKVGISFAALCIEKHDTVFHRANMAYAAYISGITLAHAGLGVVHGLASPLGALFGIPHGIACGTMLAAATKATIQKLKNMGDSYYIKKYAAIAKALTLCNNQSDIDCCNKLISTLEKWIALLNIPRLSEYGVTQEDFHVIIHDGGNKNNPVSLDEQEILQILRERL